jgi:hypothetical protein
LGHGGRGGGYDALLAELQFLGQTHGHDECLWAVHLHVMAEQWPKPRCEGLDALCLLQRTGPRKQSFKAGLVLLHGSSAAACHELAHGIGAEGRTEAEIEELGEVPPVGGTLRLLHEDVPHLRGVFEIIRSHPYLLLWRDALLDEV